MMMGPMCGAIAAGMAQVSIAAAPYELSGIVSNVALPTGALVRGDELWMCHGAADRCIGPATARIDGLLKVLEA